MTNRSRPRKAKLIRIRGARLLRAHDRRARLDVAGTVRAPIAAASDAVEAQQRFLAYAARELRGELTLSRGGCESLRRDSVDLAATAAEVLRAHDHHGLTSTTALEPARTAGDPQLVERLLANLVDNAVRHNVLGGRLDVVTFTAAGRATFTIANTGPVIPTGELTRIFEPFQQLSSHAGPSANGVGLGLAIVRAIANSHDATVTAQARTGGGLGIGVAFPALD
jgi:signal transduction histidine kinase